VKVVLATASSLPAREVETAGLAEALTGLGVEAEVKAWDEQFDWAAVDLVVVRTTWDYTDRLGEFIGWAGRVDAVTRLVNPLAAIAWNCHKGYLLELARAGVATVPTVLLTRGEDGPPGGLYELCGPGGEVVVKPAVSAGARGARRGRPDDPALLEHLHGLRQGGDVLVQPLIDSVLDRGEVSLMILGGHFSHAVRKVPRAGEYRVQEQYGGTVIPVAPSDEERSVARAALDQVPAPCLYARVDLVETTDGPVVMELEVIEPYMFLPDGPGATERFARLIAGMPPVP
jgi:glutathione synthase/RimK-type ligase-like ATP-grasp enzyme